MLDAIAQQETICISKFGRQVKTPCKHAKIPGLDADFCKTCSTWWIDDLERSIFEHRKRKANQGKLSAVHPLDRAELIKHIARP